MSAYVRILQQMLPPPSPKPEPRTLEARFLEWFNGLPEFTRQRPFSMQEFEAALGIQGRHLSRVLIRLGWVRKRKWDGTSHYHRYWVFQPSANP
jgi:hypothetical protein